MDEMKAKLVSVLSLQPLGTIAMAELVKQYKLINKEKLDFKGLGFESLQKLLEAMPDTFQVKYDKKSSDYRVLLINYEVNEEIEKAISNQSQRTNFLDTSDAARRFNSYDDRQSDSFVDRTRTSEDGPVVASHLRQKPIPTVFRGQNDWELFVRNFPNGTKESDLMDVFKTYGCTRVRIKTKRETESQFAFAVFRDYSDAEDAYVNLDGKDFKGRPLIIAFARSSIAPEDEVRVRLEKTQFTTEVTSSRHRRFSSDNEGSVDRKSAAQTDLFNCRRSTSHVEPRCHSPHGKYIPWQPFTGPGHTTTEDNAQNIRRETGATSTRSNGRVSRNTNPNQTGQGEANCINGENSSDNGELCRDRKGGVKSNSSRTVQLFPDAVGARDSEDVAVVARKSNERDVGQINPWEQDGRSEQLCSSQRNVNRSSERTVEMFTELKFDRRQSGSRDARESLDEVGAGEISKNQRHLVSVKSEEETERLESVSEKETLGHLDASTNSELPCTTESRSSGSQEISGQIELRDEIVRSTLETSNRDSEAVITNAVGDGQDKNGCPIPNTNCISDHISLSETKNYSTFTRDTFDAAISKSEVNIEHSPGSCRGSLHKGTKECTIQNIGNKERGSVPFRALKTSSGVAPRRSRVYVRDEIFLVKDILNWTKVYSRNGLDLGQLKCQFRPLNLFKKSSAPEFLNSSVETATSLKPETEPIPSESMSVTAKTSSTSNTSIIIQDESSVVSCCENIPETMDVRFLEKMLKESRIKQGFLSHVDLPDKLELIVIHVCNSNHFWGSVINSGEFMDEYEELFQMMSDIALKARPEYRLDKAAAEDKRAGVLYQETDWCRVWIRSPAGNSEVEVFYVDYGNSEYRSRDDLWILPRKAWDLRPMVLPFHLTGSLAKETLFEMVNTKITVKLIRPQPLNLGFVVAVQPYKELDSVEID